MVASGQAAQRMSSTFAETDLVQDDPDSSSYELRAITEEIGIDDKGPGEEALTSKGATKESKVADAPPDKPVPLPSEVTAAASRVVGSDSPAGPEPAEVLGVVETWYSRVLQVWGIVLLVWAALILGRSLLRASLTGEVSPGDGHPIPIVISVLLLVAGAAGLFLAVDYGRSLRAGLRSKPSDQARAKPTLVYPPGMRLRRSWHRPFREPEPTHS
jgi:hypothetical protein